MSIIKKYLPIGLTVFSAAIFLDSLRFKFTDHPNTQEIFGRLSDWITSLGAPDLFAKSGIFSQYVIGSAELVASVLLIIGLFSRFNKLGVLGNLIALGVMTGAISFHLFTPLGIDPNNDGGGLFMAAVAVWASQIIMLWLRRDTLIGLLRNPLSLFKSAEA
ncbi:MAG: DoxX family membrane protein [Pseudomonadota bacterium]